MFPLQETVPPTPAHEPTGTAPRPSADLAKVEPAMPLSFFNTMTRRTEPFVPIREGEVRLYTCGPTVYNFAHIGNFRTYAFEDLLRRYLKYRGYQVTQVMNITDIEDKIIKAHVASGKPVDAITAPFIQAFHEDLATLRIEPAEHYPRATTYVVPAMVEMVEALLAKGYAYKSDDGSVYFNIRRFPAYGSLAHFQVEDLVAGARVKQDEYDKESASDFALWKAWDAADGEVYWETSLGKGRPGWHLECSAMSMGLLGEHFDIHTGGEDNIFPHHENEIAQSEAYTGKRFVNYWLHSRHLLVDDTKMSKSKGNFYTLRELLEDHNKPWYAIRYLYISSHYRSQINFTFDGLEMAGRTVERMRELVRRVGERRGVAQEAVPAIAEAVRLTQVEFEAALDDDLNSSKALAAVHTLISSLNRWIDEGLVGATEAELVLSFFGSIDRVLGLELLKVLEVDDLDEAIQALVDERQAARARKDFARSDAIRAELLAQGIIIEDTPAGVRWKRA
jgi:cysteinyl-tRNA synthetase